MKLTEKQRRFLLHNPALQLQVARFRSDYGEGVARNYLKSVMEPPFIPGKIQNFCQSRTPMTLSRELVLGILSQGECDRKSIKAQTGLAKGAIAVAVVQLENEGVIVSRFNPAQRKATKLYSLAQVRVTA